jgi:hypothetical protein
LSSRQFHNAGCLFVAGLVAIGCSRNTGDTMLLSEIPTTENFCLEAQRVVTRTTIPMRLVINEDFTAFVKSKAVIEGPEIQQFNWYNEAGEVIGYSCKLKSADHLQMTFGEDSAGPDGACQQMNQGVFELVAKEVRDPVFTKVVFDPNETVSNEENPGMSGPDWLAPYTMDYSVGGELHIASKGFIVDFTDEQFAKAPPRFRGVHYCHLIAPEHLRALLKGEVEPGNRIGREVPKNFPSSAPVPAQGGES